MNDLTWTAGAWRALALAGRLANEVEAPRTEPLHLLWALLLEESRASALLAEHGLRRQALSGLCPLDDATLCRLTTAVGASGTPELRLAGAVPRSSGEPGDLLSEVVFEARRRAGRAGNEAEVGSEHLLWGLATAESPVATLLGQVGIDAGTLAEQVDGPAGSVGEPIPTDERLERRRVGEPKDRRNEELQGDAGRGPERLRGERVECGEGNDIDLLRVLDAAGNRAREGLRVVEDYARFVLDDVHLTRLLKEVRHELAEVVAEACEASCGAAASQPGDPLRKGDRHPRMRETRDVSDSRRESAPFLQNAAARLLAARDTVADVGIAIHTESEGRRESVADVVVANFRRVQEAIRTLEEFGKLLSPGTGAALGQLRYRLYTLEKALSLTADRRRRLAGCRLYLLVTSALCRGDVESVVREALAGGVDAVQLREKSLGDRELVDLGRRMREWTREAGVLFIMNDRPDLAVLCDADGVHVGQDELSVRDARRIVGTDRLVGVSTHTIEQARQAVLDGADYLGVGPVFPSRTKEFASLAGLEFVREVAGEITLPWFAIGGIAGENLKDVLGAGATRIAVSGAICESDEPQRAAAGLDGRLGEA